MLRRLAHVPLGWRATILHVRIRRYRCSGYGQVWREDTPGEVGKHKAKKGDYSTCDYATYEWPKKQD